VSPIRICVVCGERKEKARMFRIASNFLIDPEQTFIGRGAYLCKIENCVQKITGKTTFSRSLHKSPTKDEFKYLTQRVLKVMNGQD